MGDSKTPEDPRAPTTGALAREATHGVASIESALCRALQVALKDLSPAGRGLGIAFSGGADSTVLARLLAPRALRTGRPVVLLHVHHGWQSQADAWAENAQSVAEQLGVEYRVLRVQLQARGRGWEAEARTRRHQALQQAAQELRLGSIWLAHHADDQAETILQRLCRGTGLEGLQAMPAWRWQDGLWWVRPWLHQRASAIRALARARRWPWIEDPSNTQTHLARGHLRASVLPELTRHWPQAPRALARVAEQMQMLWPWIEQQVEQALLACLCAANNTHSLDLGGPQGLNTALNAAEPCDPEGTGPKTYATAPRPYAQDALSVPALLELDPALQPWVLRAWLNRCAGEALAQHERLYQLLEFLKHSPRRRHTWRFAGVGGAWTVQLHNGQLQLKSVEQTTNLQEPL